LSIKAHVTEFVNDEQPITISVGIQSMKNFSWMGIIRFCTMKLADL
jgi:hypothetical protein